MWWGGGFLVGSWVRIRRPLQGHKLRGVLSGPLQVLGRVGVDTYVLSDGQKWHANRLVKARQGGSTGADASLQDCQFGEPVQAGDQEGNGEHEGAGQPLIGQAEDQVSDREQEDTGQQNQVRRSTRSGSGHDG